MILEILQLELRFVVVVKDLLIYQFPGSQLDTASLLLRYLKFKFGRRQLIANPYIMRPHPTHLTWGTFSRILWLE